MNEREFIQKCLRKDKAAWDEFVEKYSRLIYNYIYSILKVKGIYPSPEVVEDLFQDFFLSLIKDDFRKLRCFKGKNNATLASWLRIITINFCLDYLRKEKHSTISLDYGPEEGKFSLKDILVDQRHRADVSLTDKEKLQHLYDCIRNLNSQDKYFLEMHVHQGINLDDLQTTLGISRSAVDMRKFRLIEKLKNCFKKKGFQLDY
ncbi:MAG: sigma-70 family RNA polymerase sigma factor [Candidatus Omnitrophica bacterium]|nr:sigma-70 family RNA polymerase sigma factor [Candidatus Omnitrophota bacterium]MBU1871990.1 sigma-70 family RNA polymerase sigma factor [Candidatus Omnitrophota bacterium]